VAIRARAALGALGRFDDPRIGRDLVAAYGQLPADQDVRPTAVGVLVSRPAWAAALLESVAAGTIPRADLPPEQVERLRQSDDPAVVALADKVFNKPAEATSAEKAKEVAARQGNSRRRPWRCEGRRGAVHRPLRQLPHAVRPGRQGSAPT
jgi:hypothetical protein